MLVDGRGAVLERLMLEMRTKGSGPKKNKKTEKACRLADGETELRNFGLRGASGKCNRAFLGRLWRKA